MYLFYFLTTVLLLLQIVEDEYQSTVLLATQSVHVSEACPKIFHIEFLNLKHNLPSYSIFYVCSYLNKCLLTGKCAC